VATAVFVAGIALAIVGFGLAVTAVVSPVTGGIEVPALHSRYAGAAIGFFALGAAAARPTLSPRAGMICGRSTVVRMPGGAAHT
jgi:hypothetical protein